MEDKMSHTLRAGAITTVLILSGLSLPAKADFTICNRTAESVDVTAAYVNPNGGFISEGWWTLRPCGGCELVVLSRETSDPHNVFFHGHGGGRVWEGRDRFCTKQSAFKIVGNQNCAARGFGVRGFRHVTSKSGNHTTTLTGKTSSGKVCID
jgi:uncharacterized membrane protein